MKEEADLLSAEFERRSTEKTNASDLLSRLTTELDETKRLAAVKENEAQSMADAVPTAQEAEKGAAEALEAAQAKHSENQVALSAAEKAAGVVDEGEMSNRISTLTDQEKSLKKKCDEANELYLKKWKISEGRRVAKRARENELKQQEDQEASLRKQHSQAEAALKPLENDKATSEARFKEAERLREAAEALAPDVASSVMKVGKRAYQAVFGGGNDKAQKEEDEKRLRTEKKKATTSRQKAETAVQDAHAELVDAEQKYNKAREEATAARTKVKEVRENLEIEKRALKKSQESDKATLGGELDALQQAVKVSEAALTQAAERAHTTEQAARDAERADEKVKGEHKSLAGRIQTLSGELEGEMGAKARDEAAKREHATTSKRLDALRTALFEAERMAAVRSHIRAARLDKELEEVNEQVAHAKDEMTRLEAEHANLDGALKQSEDKYKAKQDERKLREKKKNEMENILAEIQAQIDKYEAQPRPKCANARFKAHTSLCNLHSLSLGICASHSAGPFCQWSAASEGRSVNVCRIRFVTASKAQGSSRMH